MTQSFLPEIGLPEDIVLEARSALERWWLSISPGDLLLIGSSTTGEHARLLAQGSASDLDLVGLVPDDFPQEQFAQLRSELRVRMAGVSAAMAFTHIGARFRRFTQWPAFCEHLHHAGYAVDRFAVPVVRGRVTMASQRPPVAAPRLAAQVRFGMELLWGGLRTVASWDAAAPPLSDARRQCAKLCLQYLNWLLTSSGIYLGRDSERVSVALVRTGLAVSRCEWDLILGAKLQLGEIASLALLHRVHDLLLAKVDAALHDACGRLDDSDVSVALSHWTDAPEPSLAMLAELLECLLRWNAAWMGEGLRGLARERTLTFSAIGTGSVLGVRPEALSPAGLADALHRLRILNSAASRLDWG